MVEKIVSFCQLELNYLNMLILGGYFRPDYLKLGQLRKLTGSTTSWVALTATASEKVAKGLREEPLVT